MTKRKRGCYKNHKTITLFKEYPLAILALILAVLWFYSLGNLYLSAGYAAETTGRYTAEPAWEEPMEKSLAVLKDRAVSLKDRRAEKTQLLELTNFSGISPCYSGRGETTENDSLSAEEPPTVRIRALAVCGGEKIAVVDIDGGDTKLVRENDSLAGSSARVLGINSRDVVWSWNSREFHSSLFE